MPTLQRRQPRTFQRLPGSEAKRANDLLPAPLLQALRALFPPKRVEYIAHILSYDELHILPDLHDALIIARLQRMTPDQLRRFDNYIPLQQKAYELTQLRWIQDEEYLLGLRLGRPPTHRELSLDFANRQTGLRFRGYYTLKYPDRMKRRDRPLRPAPPT